jgi:hypothetical protein
MSDRLEQSERAAHDAKDLIGIDLTFSAAKSVPSRRSSAATKNLVIAKFRHETSLEQDPQLHTQGLVINLARRSDGEWRALRNDEIRRRSTSAPYIDRSSRRSHNRARQPRRRRPIGAA